MRAVGPGGRDAAFDTEVLSGSLGSRIDLAVKRGAARRRELLELVRPYLAGVDARVKRDLPVARRVICHLIEHRPDEELVEGETLTTVVAAAAEPSKRIRKGLRWYADLPFGDQLPSDLLRLRRSDLVPVTHIDDIVWADGKLRVTGFAYLAGLSVRSRRFNWATVVLRGPRWLPPIRMRTRRVLAPEATHGAREPGCNYDWSGFTAELSPWSLRWRGAVRGAVSAVRRRMRHRPSVPDATTWRAEIVFWSRGARATGLLRGFSIGRAERPAGRRLKPGWWARPVWTSDRALQIVLQPNRAELKGVSVDGERLELTISLPGRTVTKGHARLGGHRIAADFTPSGDGTQVVVGLAVPALLQEKDGRRLWVEPKGDPAASVMLADLVETRTTVGDREITVLGDRRDRVVVSAHRIRPVITSAVWEGPELVLRGDYPDAVGPRTLTLRHRSGLSYWIPMERSGDAFTVRVRPAGMDRFGDAVPLASGTWNMSLRHPSGEIVPLRVDHAALPGFDEDPRTFDGRTYRMISTRFDVPVVTVEEDRPADERGVAGTHVLRRVFYPAQRTEPLTDATVYVVNDGRLYADSVRAIYEERLRRGDDREHIWIVKDGAFVPQGGATVVRAGSREHHAALARSRHIIANAFLPTWFRAREDQVVVQTWHGTPAKHMGNDQPHMQRDPRPPIWHRQAAEVRGWDLLLSQSPWATPVLRKAFGYKGEVLESGLPRNDVLTSPDREALAAAVRARLGLAPGKRVILYAPTWRDYDRKNAMVKLDLAKAREALGADHEILVRAHPMQAMPAVPDIARDVTTYPDIAELLLVTDVLVTDYSSVMFDFACTGRPIVFYGYDLAKYSSKRGLYIDLPEQAPGPVLSTSAEVIDALRSIDEVAAAHADRYDAFRATFAPKDDGKATARVVDHLFP
ncbi:CDP-glycerol glycerophosphotransferase family protein [Nonomuraea sp. KC401]|uniref:CDP-glycerol glycerophosphotransferase family protein n=1 Tax=unclassified Nonomuraea TaxID=2593643 RepID=UPI0010FEC49D|nr:MULTISPECIES: CDP-glycerol glycerophosphotransferase family protein [unclassified Nonomuraea]NBE97024.1 glycosyl transferase [Nonomuraea sp. K271]TLF71621.1 CDP-glycerol glycerophosphotransferase family protein [Nonomuraea sp. KC401]